MNPWKSVFIWLQFLFCAVTLDAVAQSAHPKQLGPENTLNVIYFEFESSNIPLSYQPMIEAHAAFLKSNPDARLSLEGHDDASRSVQEFTLSMAQRRASAVRQALALMGVSHVQMEAVSFGSTKPAAAEFHEAAFAKNRRVEFFYR